jgi:hypothetical protein
MVLDNYKQMYIGQSLDIKRRILQHWEAIKQFDRLIYGRVDNSVLSIDCFGALDTTRIFILATNDLDASEKMIINNVQSIYKLNRVGGGVPRGFLDMLGVLANTNHRDLTSK